MARQAYKRFNFSDKSLSLIRTMTNIIIDYVEQGFRLTVRQLYYQLVARDVIPNNERSYKSVTSLVNDARLAGLIDWDVIEDRTRAFVRRQRWDSGRDILHAVANSFHMDMWANQNARPFMIVEKEALVGVLEPTCRKLDIPLLAARGYPSVSVLREFAIEDILPTVAGQDIIIIHLGDHDPSGIDMTRDLRERIELFSEGNAIELVRIALNMDQILERKPPPNPAKTTDSRFEEYRRQFGDESWELDSLEPVYLAKLVEDKIATYVDEERWAEREQEIADISSRLARIAKRFKN